MQDCIEESDQLLLTPEEIREMSQILAKTLAQQLTRENAEITIATCVSGYRIETENQIAQVINLDMLASASAGVLDPLGQLRDWFISVFNSVSSWIVSAVQSFTQNAISGLGDFINNTIRPLIINSIVGFINDWVLPVIRGITPGILSYINTYVIPFLVDIAPKIASVITIISGAIADAITRISSAIESAIYRISSAMSSGLRDLSSALSLSIERVSLAILSSVRDVSVAVSSGIRDVLSALSYGLREVSLTISSSISLISNTISLSMREVSSALSLGLRDVFSALSSSMEKVSSALSSGIREVSSTLSSGIRDVSSALSSGLRDVSSAVSFGIKEISSALSLSIGKLLSALSSGLEKISSTLSSGIREVSSALSSGIDRVSSALSAGIEKISLALSSGIDRVFSALSSGIEKISSALSSGLRDVSSALSAGIKEISSSVSLAISSGLEKISSALSSAIRDVSSALSSGIKEISSSVSSALSEMGRTIANMLNGIGKGVSDLWNLLIGSFQDISAKIGAGFDVIGTSLMGFINAILKFPEWFPTWFKEYLVDPLTKWITENAFVWLESKFLVKIEEHTPYYSPSPETPQIKYPKGYIPTPSVKLAIPIFPNIEALSNPFKWITEKIIGAISGWLDSLWNALQGVWNWIISAIGKFAEWLWNGILALGQGALSLLSSGFKGLMDIGEKLVAGLRETLITPILDLFNAVFMGLKDYVTGMVQRIATGKSQGEMAEALGLFGIIISTQFTFRMISQALFWIGEMTSDWKILPNVAIKILGAGGETTVEIPLKFGAVIKHLAAEFKHYPDELMRGFFYGISIWITQPIVRSINSMLRNAIPIELPAVDVLVEAARRALPHEKFNEMIDKAKYFMGLYGYSDYAIDLYFKPVKDFNIKVTDRFGTERIVPLSLMYDLPSASDVATMMVRDIFQTPEDFFRIYSARGMHSDIGTLYYFLRFRYPPPERIWQFTMRGISGLLWATLTDTEKREIAEEIKAMKAIMPTSPTELNFKADALMSAFKTYMKWHDYFRGAWIQGFTSDNLMYIDSLADIPTKIDQRWMVKWGLYELLSKKTVTLKSESKEFASKVLEPTAASKIMLDLTNFSRTLQATGIHPYWVPITAVAETMNVLTEERTMLRTGATNLFKEGFYDYTAISKLLSEAIVVSFKVAYFDMDKMSWTEGYINQPVMFLPAEQKLIQIRALMDRSLDILKEIQRDISVAYQDYIISTEKEYEETLTKVITHVNEFYAKDYQNITGTSLPEILKLKYVKEYYEPYVKALDTMRSVYVIRRIRAWTQRWVGWIMYRIATGVAKKEDVQKLIDTVSEHAMLTDKEKVFLKDIMDLMYMLATREYIPTPTQLASLSEYIVIPQDLIEKCFEARMVPEDWRAIWKNYISIRPVADDIKSLISSYRRALLYTKIPADIEKQILSYAEKINFTKEEMDILSLRVTLDQLVQESREYVPTPYTLGLIAEYVPISPELMNKVFDARRIPDEWRPTWTQFISYYPIKPEAKSLLSTYVSAKKYGAISKDEFTAFLKELPNFGFTNKEIELITRRVELEETVLQLRGGVVEYIPSPSTLVTFAEYVSLPSELVTKVFEARKIPKEWADIWMYYLNIRPLADDVRVLVNAYYRARRYQIQLGAIEKQVLDILKTSGMTDQELSIRDLATQIEIAVSEYLENKREYIPTPSALASICEVIPEARQFFDEVMTARRVPQNWQEMWAKYIDYKPIIDEVKKMLTRVENLYEYFAISEDTYKEVLKSVQYLGWTDKEIEYMLEVSRYARWLRAYRELIGDVDRMVAISNYSPKAEEFALGNLYKMIDAMPIDTTTKQTLKSMWEQFIRNRHVKDEVITYVRDLVNLYVAGQLSKPDLEKELTWLENWGLSKYEREFWLKIADARLAKKLKIPVAFAE